MCRKMEQLSEFVTNHWILVTLFIVVSLALLTNIARSAGGVTPNQAVNMMNKNNAVVIDVRPEKDFKKGHIIGSKNFPASRLPQMKGKLEKYKDSSVLVCCQSGNASADSAKKIRELGVVSAQTIKGGIFAWEQEGLPLEIVN